MDLFEPPPEWSNPKVFRRSKTQRDIALTPLKVYDMARHYYTLDEIAEAFQVERLTLQLDEECHTAFLEGKRNAMQKPRMLLLKLFNDFTDKDLSDKDVPVGNLLKAMELHAKKHEGMADKVVVHEKPSVSDVKFDPLTK